MSDAGRSGDGADRAPAGGSARRRSRPLARQAAEGIGVVVALALGAIVTGLVIAVVVALVF